MSVKLLYWGRSWSKLTRGGRRIFEHHPYYQLEVCVSGKIAVKMPDCEFMLYSGDMLLIPPGCGHCVVYPDTDNEFYSLKFEAAGFAVAAPVFSAGCRFNNWCIKSFGECHESEARHALPVDASSREIVEGLLLLSMNHLLSGRNVDKEEPPIFRKIHQTALRGGVVMNVADCAAALNINVPQLNYQFRKELHEYNLDPADYSVKKIIDQALLYLIDRYLDFSDLSLSTIARQMRFNNVYTFSRYYKRLTGFSPKERRTRHK